jgi:hypothetical protein
MKAKHIAWAIAALIFGFIAWACWMAEGIPAFLLGYKRVYSIKNGRPVPVYEPDPRKKVAAIYVATHGDRMFADGKHGSFGTVCGGGNIIEFTDGTSVFVAYLAYGGDRSGLKFVKPTNRPD